MAFASRDIFEILTIDILRMTTDGTGSRLFSEDGFENTQVIILDSQDDGPYFDLWGLFSKKPIKRIHEITDWSTITPTNIIIALAGSSNPLWQGDWGSHSFDFYQAGIEVIENIFDVQAAQDSSTILVTYIDRRQKRRLIDQEEYLREVQERFPHIRVQNVDFASIPFKEQICILQKTDILVGVHGAGLPHAMFLKPKSVVVEILPSSCNFNMFQHLARLRGHIYYSAHGAEVDIDPVKRDRDLKDVTISKERFLKLMEMAIKSLYNTGLRSYDAV
ncbi:glycosyltransferase, putative [Talaromyces stipitatus ATCC 10500]|uniref:EGF domain-specific O-linked N-acetylglucosamine transferase n=1 Tax=Talaromyces stipitatus (strain ATCC 10500 / CBS 375.48 / QM 6759 / NRRL 1006) TaxID=441959 RepID=B8MUR5_TALSN|nr:glycosyltransferase, putative [Talaromyces stipitatus ATCC 10500]EED11803.1 glycosyltransferase, putative [Talaromyces stipitatus ATCC 10500]